MAFSILAGGGPVNGLTSVYIDTTVNITPTFTRRVTTHPIEGGGNINDHSYKENLEIDIEGIFAQHSLRMGEDTISPSGDRVRDAYQLLRGIHDRGELISVSSELEAYSNCLMTSLSFPRTSADGFVLPFSMRLEQLQIAETQTIQVSQALVDRAVTVVRASQKTPTDTTSPDASEQTISRAANVNRVLDGISSGIGGP